MSVQEVREIVERHEGERGDLISILEEIQGKYSYLPEEALRVVADTTGRPLVDVYGVATFYKWFSLKPRGKHLVSCCVGTACHVRGAPKVAEALRKDLGVGAGETTPDREFTLETVNCLGACALGPIVVADGHYFPNTTSAQVKSILVRTAQGLDHVDVAIDQRIFPVEVACARCNHSLMDSRYLVDGAPAIRVTIAFGESHGPLLLSCLYGSFNTQAEFEVPVNTVVEFYCPHCHAELKGGPTCGDCSAPMVPMIVKGGGMLQICSRRGCRAHLLDLSGVNL
jgi:NADH:ubiquinone oxidoreductase subunit E